MTTVELGRALRADGAGPDGRNQYPPRRRRRHRRHDQRRAGYLKEKEPEDQGGASTPGSVLKKYKETGILDKNEITAYHRGHRRLCRRTSTLGDRSLREGHRQGRRADDAADRAGGGFAGNSAGSAMAGLLQPLTTSAGDVIVVIFRPRPPSGKMFNDDWMREKGFFERKRHDRARSVAAGISGALRSIDAPSGVGGGAADGRTTSRRSRSRTTAGSSARSTRPISTRSWSGTRRSRPSRSSRSCSLRFLVDVSTPVDLLSTMITPVTPPSRARFQDRSDLHHHEVGRSGCSEAPA